MQARLILEDGTTFTGKAFGSLEEKSGEVVFHTGMFNYQDVLSNPVYCGQIVVMTYPLIGNYGITRYDFEAVAPYIQGLVVREYEEVPSNWCSQYSLDALMRKYGIIGISEIDTRMLTRLVREKGTMRGMITTEALPISELQAKLAATEPMRDQVSRVSTKTIYANPGYNEKIVLIDYGAKSNILRDLTKLDCDVVVVPYNTTAEQIRELHPHGIVLSNGPGNPKDLPECIETIKQLAEHYPMFGIGLGHQLFALACGADTVKTKFGHRGSNHPVKDMRTGKCYITTQNHGYTVVPESLANTQLQVTYVHNNDGEIEGVQHEQYPAMSVQFHPETTPGFFDTSFLFDQFIQMIREHRKLKPSRPRQTELLDQFLQGNQAAAGTLKKGVLEYAKK